MLAATVEVWIFLIAFLHSAFAARMVGSNLRTSFPNFHTRNSVSNIVNCICDYSYWSDEMTSENKPWSKKYGLIIPKQEKAAQAIDSRRSQIRAFRESSSSSEEDDGNTTSGPVSKYGNTTKRRTVKKQEEREAARALEQDSTVFQYDEIYEDIQAQKLGTIPEEARKADKERKPKYVENLLKAASKRKRDLEARVEKQQQREREKEGDEFADKEVFVTAAYRKKMEEIAAYEEEERRKEQLDDMTDVKKQAGLSGFYRHLLEQRTGNPMDFENPPPKVPKQEIKEEPKDPNVSSEPPQNVPSAVSRLDSERPSTSAFNRANSGGKMPALNKKSSMNGKSSGIKKTYRGRDQRVSSGSDDDNGKKGERQPQTGHTIYSSSSDEEEARPPTPEPRAGLRFVMKAAVPLARKSGSSNSSDAETPNVDETRKRLSSESDTSRSDQEASDSLKKSSVSKNKSPKPSKAESSEEGMEGATLFGRTETDQERLAKLRTLYARRHTDADLAAYRDRYFARVANRAAIATAVQ